MNKGEIRNRNLMVRLTMNKRNHRIHSQLHSVISHLYLVIIKEN